MARSSITSPYLRDYSNYIFNSTSRWVEVEDGELSLISARALAVSSKVTMRDGLEMHIPMLDFINEIDMDNLGEEEIVQVKQSTGGRRGYILQTDNSLHFWGLDLLSEAEWKNWIENVNRKGGNLVDGEFINISIERGYCALRVFDYLPFKNVEPHVVDIII